MCCVTLHRMDEPMPAQPARRPQQPARRTVAAKPTIATPVRQAAAGTPQTMTKDEIIRSLKGRIDRLEEEKKQLKGIAVAMHTASTKNSSIPARNLSDFSRQLLAVINGRRK